MYSYKKSIKSNFSDELINTYLIRPIAGLIVLPLYYTPITPNQVTIASIISGICASFFYLKGSADSYLIAGILITLKDILDSVDGQLARAKQKYSRIGRFLDSIGDFVVDLLVFTAIGWALFRHTGNILMLILSFLGLIGITFRVSYHVFYQVKFLHLQNKYLCNRIFEEVLNEDLKRGGMELILQKNFLFIYGWQDKLAASIDRWSYNYNPRIGEESCHKLWYSDYTALRISSFLGLGTELFLLMICSVLNELELYLYLNLILMNGIMLICISYRRWILTKKILS